jgi:hypothetical protein
MGYAISFLLLIGMVCSGVLFVSSTNKRLELNYELNEHMLFNNYFGLKFGATMQQAGQKEIVHPSGDTSTIVAREWGAFRAITSITTHGNRKVEKSALMGHQMEQKPAVLYLPNRKQVIKLCGKTLIEGDVYSSQRGFERGHIAGRRFEGDKLLHGRLLESERNLPKLNASFDNLTADILKTTHKIEGLTKDSSFSFTESTSLWSSVEPIHLQYNLEGNLVIQSFDSIFVSADITLNHVILMAPLIRFEKGFVGCVQAFADKQINCEEGVKLNYPSALILTEKKQGRTDLRSGIFLNKNVRVLGGILLRSEEQDFRNPVYLGIDQAVVGGMVFNQGETELKGKIIGSLYTDKLALKVGGGQYSGYLFDATLSSKQLPDDFVMPNWLDEERGKPILLTCF